MTERQSARMSKIKNARLDQYGAEPFEQQQFGTAGVEGVKPAQLAFSANYNIGLVILTYYRRYHGSLAQNARTLSPFTVICLAYHTDL